MPKSKEVQKQKKGNIDLYMSKKRTQEPTERDPHSKAEMIQ